MAATVKRELNLQIIAKNVAGAEASIKRVAGSLNSVDSAMDKNARNTRVTAMFAKLNFARKSATGLFNAVSRVTRFTSGAVMKLTSALVGSVEAADAQDRALKRLNVTMKTYSGYSDKAYKDIIRYTEQLQTYTSMADNILQVGASQLGSFQMSADGIRTLLPALTDLMAATYGLDVTEQGAIQSANLLGKAFMGQVGALTRVGILVDAVNAKILKTGSQEEKYKALANIVKANYGGLARSNARSYKGFVLAIKNGLSDTFESFGMGLAKELLIISLLD